MQPVNGYESILRFQCLNGTGEHVGKVVYHTQPANILSLGIPLNAVDNQSEIDDEQERKRQKNEDGKKGEVQTDLLPNVPWKALVEHFSLPSTVCEAPGPPGHPTHDLKVSKDVLGH